ncbi:MAG: hypothetical protein HC817_09845 [Saprospiraceae bacterium]|nr:hypothetical protein [Saprospiraceae bacterium]
MKKIGIVGENYQNDACAFKLLMTPQYKDRVTFIPIVKRPNTGIQKLGGLIRAEMENNKLDAVICLKDLDTHPELEEKEKWFSDLNKIIKKGVFYLVVMELEALFLADMDNINAVFSLKNKLVYKGNPIKELKPKEWLKNRTDGKYSENDSCKICRTINFEKVCTTHTGERSFQEFIVHFNDLLEKN